ncbi:hypothetical protein PTTG_05590 [Puccinia triticina 1-1 BBBD Race 1]|uniref:Zn(2)-C6 fungal-type domain-containing protein n=2 Tax=Puccinia triticina TaxID=208348 RepID=A0A180GK99_PUCT1|nr:uncharacterized protein PtA15_11A73 [Puccinia triticina]OAV93216.1 hypothetical protein PTTG_05590 [Puccinia triticina 1-1 BBBD Race 1]WAQ89386.1 hypothetical protein PtA15_11A73 [Puccinia triticina]WAR59438.1 hypothetical protein PtB15_11B78 [Puccinia triticina]
MENRPPKPARRTNITTIRKASNALHRNKACLNCRARKTKCDAVKPICSSCKRLGPEQQSQCKYDQPPKWLESVVCPNRTQQNRIAELELKLESLERTLAQRRTSAAIKHEQQQQLPLPLPTGITYQTTPHLQTQPTPFFVSDQNSHLFALAKQDELTDPYHQAFQPLYAADHPHPHHRHRQSISLIDNPPINHSLVIRQHDGQLTQVRQHDGQLTQAEFNPYPYHFITPILDSPSPSATSSIPDPSPPSPYHLHQLSAAQTFDPCLPISEPNWYPHLPSRKICKLLIKAFFNRPLSPFTLVEPIGLQSRLDLSILDPHFPEPVLIHAICATGAQYISRELLAPVYWSHPQGPHVHHAEWAERLLNTGIATLREPRKLLELAEAAVLCCQYYTVVGKPLMIWKCLGCCIRLSTLVGLNLNSHNNHSFSRPQHNIAYNDPGLEKVSFWPDGVGVLDRPTNANIQHYRTLLWWYVFCCDKMCSAAGGFASTVDERDSLIPISSPAIYRVNEQDGSQRPMTREEEAEEREFFSPSSPSFFYKHRTGDQGSLQLLIKAAILLGKVNTTLYRRSHPAKTAQEIQHEHESLSNLIWGLYHSIPPSFKNPFKLTRYGQLDACLLSAHTLIHTSLIQLNEDLVCLDLHPPAEDAHLQICQLSGQLLIDWFLQLIQHKNLGLISVDLGQLLCGNPTLNFGLSVAMRTHCRLIAINRVFKPSACTEHDSLSLQIEQILGHLSKSAKMPLEGRIIELITGLLQNPYSLLPRSLLFPIIDPSRTTYYQLPNNTHPPPHQGLIKKLGDDDGHESMKSNFALARMLNCSSL